MIWSQCTVVTLRGLLITAVLYSERQAFTLEFSKKPGGFGPSVISMYILPQGEDTRSNNAS